MVGGRAHADSNGPTNKMPPEPWGPMTAWRPLTQRHQSRKERPGWLGPPLSLWLSCALPLLSDSFLSGLKEGGPLSEKCGLLEVSRGELECKPWAHSEVEAGKQSKLWLSWDPPCRGHRDAWGPWQGQSELARGSPDIGADGPRLAFLDPDLSKCESQALFRPKVLGSRGFSFTSGKTGIKEKTATLKTHFVLGRRIRVSYKIPCLVPQLAVSGRHRYWLCISYLLPLANYSRSWQCKETHTYCLWVGGPGMAQLLPALQSLAWTATTMSVGAAVSSEGSTLRGSISQLAQGLLAAVGHGWRLSSVLCHVGPSRVVICFPKVGKPRRQESLLAGWKPKAFVT